jgi:hypothetical protein
MASRYDVAPPAGAVPTDDCGYSPLALYLSRIQWRSFCLRCDANPHTTGYASCAPAASTPAHEARSMETCIHRLVAHSAARHTSILGLPHTIASAAEYLAPGNIEPARASQTDTHLLWIEEISNPQYRG